LYFKHFDEGKFDHPDWIGDFFLHQSHQSNLIRKDPIFYGSKFPGVPSDIEYVWPEGRLS
jgi:hypothetical protein